MMNLFSIAILGCLAVVPSLAIYGIKRMHLTPDEQFEHINMATRKLNAESQSMLHSVCRTQRSDPLGDIIHQLIDFLNELGKSLRSNLDVKDGIRDVTIGGKVIKSPRTVDDQAVPQATSLKVYKRKCWRKPSCNLGQGIFGKCFTNAIKFAIMFHMAMINSMTFPDNPDSAVVTYPNDMCSVVWHAEQLIMNFFFRFVPKMSKQALAALAATFSMAMKLVIKIVFNTTQQQGNCTTISNPSLTIPGGFALDCTNNCTICGFQNVTLIPEHRYCHHDDPNRKLNITSPLNIPPLSWTVDLLFPDGRKEKSDIVVRDTTADLNVAFNPTGTIKPDDATILPKKHSGFEFLGPWFRNLTRSHKRDLFTKLGSLLSSVLKPKWLSLARGITSSLLNK